METKGELKPEIQSENESESIISQSSSSQGPVINENFESIHRNESNVDDGVDSNSCSSSSSSPELIPESSKSSAETDDSTTGSYFQQEALDNTPETTQEEENYNTYHFSQQQQQQHRMTEAFPDTKSNCGSEPPDVEGQGPSSLDNIQSTEGGINYLVNSETVTLDTLDMDTLKKQLNKLSITKKNSDVTSKLTPIQEENKLLKEQLKNLKQKLRNFSENSLLIQEDHEKEIVALNNQNQISMEKIECAHQVEVENYERQLNELKEKNEYLAKKLKQTDQASLKKNEEHEERVHCYKIQLKKLDEENIQERSKLEHHNQVLKDQLEQSKKNFQANNELYNKTVEDLERQLTEQVEQSKQAIQAKNKLYEKMIEDLKTKTAGYKNRIDDLQQQNTSMKEKHREEVIGLTKSKDTLTKKNSQLQSMFNPGEMLDQSSSMSTISDEDYSSLNTSFLDAVENGEEKKTYNTPTYYNRSDSKLATIDVRFAEGMVKFIEEKSSSSDLYKTYIEWYKDLVKRMDADPIYQSKRHIFLKREFHETLTVDDRRLSFSSMGSRKLSFVESRYETCDEFCNDGWPDDIDHMLVLHPNKAMFKELHRSKKKDADGKIYCKWSTSKVDYDFYYEVEDEYNVKRKTLLLCGYKEEEKK